MSTAVVLWLVASDPASGSDRQKEPIHSPEVSFGRYFCFCSSVPKASIPQQTRELLTDISTEQELSIFEISSMAST